MRYFPFLLVALNLWSTSAFAADLAQILKQLQSPERAERLVGINNARSLSSRSERAQALIGTIAALTEIEARYQQPIRDPTNYQRVRIERNRQKKQMFEEQAELEFTIGLLGKGRSDIVQELVAKYKASVESLRGNPLDPGAAATKQILAALYQSDPKLMSVQRLDRSVVNRALFMEVLSEWSMKISENMPTALSAVLDAESFRYAATLIRHGARLPFSIWSKIESLALNHAESIVDPTNAKWMALWSTFADRAVDDIFRSNKWNAFTVPKLVAIARISAYANTSIDDQASAFRTVKKIEMELERLKPRPAIELAEAKSELQEMLGNLGPRDILAEAERTLEKFLERRAADVPRVTEFYDAVEINRMARTLLLLDNREMSWYLKRAVEELPAAEARQLLVELKAMQSDGIDDIINAIPACRAVWESNP